MVFWAYLPRKETSASLPMRHRRDLSGTIDSKSISRKSLRVAEHVREMSRSTSTSRDREDLEGALAGAARPAHLKWPTSFVPSPPARFPGWPPGPSWQLRRCRCVPRCQCRRRHSGSSLDDWQQLAAEPGVEGLRSLGGAEVEHCKEPIVVKG